MYTFIAKNDIKQIFGKKIIPPSIHIYIKVANFVCQLRGTADKYFVEMHYQATSTGKKRRSPIIPFTKYLHVMPI